MVGSEASAPVVDVPPELVVVRDFVNTTDREEGTDDLTTPGELTDYLHRQGLLPRRTRSSPDDLALALQLRQGLRRALELNHDAAEASIPALEAALDRLPLRLQWTGDGSRLAPVDGGVAGGLARIAVAMNQAVAAGTWRRLKICAADDCEWAYYDASKNRARNWCEYGCGNRAKVRAYRQRRRASGD
jgi:predicted RNA-binding Zn ribbon-like protein